MIESKDIMIFSATNAFTSAAKKIIEKRYLNNKIGIIEATGQNTIILGKQIIAKGTKILIARGLNIRLLKESFNVPIIDIPYLYEEIYESVKSADCPPEEIALIGFDDCYNSMLDFQQTSGMNIQVIGPKSPDTMEKDIMGKIRPGVHFLIGGFTAKRVANKNKLSHVMLQIFPRNIEKAIDRAINILTSSESKDEYIKTIMATINSNSDAVLNISSTGEILFLNNSAKKLFKGNSLEEILLFLFPGRNPKNVVNQTEPDHKIVVKNSSGIYLVDYNPIIVNSKLKSAVIVVGNSNNIQSKEKQIRLKLNEKPPVARYTFSDVIGSSKPVKNAVYLGEKYAGSDSAVLITGDTGTGKEIFAQSIHTASHRANEPFVAINCAALPQSILESELFGYVKGTFTGANKEGKMGVFEQAHGGTLFLDEIGEMNINVQAKLLRVLQEKVINRLGDDKITYVDVRIISATNRDLEQLVSEGKFREDLLYRLNVLELHLPPLKNRKEDIPSLIEHYRLNNCPEIAFSDEVIYKLQELDYPGNVRQLFNILERTVTLSESNYIGLEHLVINMGRKKKPQENIIVSRSPQEELMKYEKEKIIDALMKNGGSRSKTAAALSISTSTLWRKMKKFNIIP